MYYKPSKNLFSAMDTHGMENTASLTAYAVISTPETFNKDMFT